MVSLLDANSQVPILTCPSVLLLKGIVPPSFETALSMSTGLRQKTVVPNFPALQYRIVVGYCIVFPEGIGRPSIPAVL